MGPWGCFCSSRSGGLEFVCLTGPRWYWCCWYGNHTLRTTAVGPGIIQSNFIFIISCCCMYNPLDPWIRLHSLKKLCPCLRITCSAVGTVLTERTPILVFPVLEHKSLAWWATQIPLREQEVITRIWRHLVIFPPGLTSEINAKNGRTPVLTLRILRSDFSLVIFFLPFSFCFVTFYT